MLDNWAAEGMEAICAEQSDCESVPVSSWSHCAGTLNPADLPSRGLTTWELSRSTLWRDGPDLSQISENVQPSDNLSGPCIVEMKTHTLMIHEQVGTMSNVIEAERFETLHKLYRVTAHASQDPSEEV